MHTTTKPTRRSLQIEAVAGLIRFSASPAEYAQEVNDSAEGWTINVVYGHEGPGWWTRTTDLHLSEADLAAAVQIAASL